MSFACHDDRRLGTFLTKHKPIVLDMITNSLVYDLLVRSDDYMKWNYFFFDCLGF